MRPSRVWLVKTLTVNAKTAWIYGCSSPKVSKLGFDPSPNHDNLREDSLDGRSVGRVDEVGISSIVWI
jgi:hypothetical protein